MEMDSCKLFIGGISWETNEDRLREYFQNFGEVLEAVIMKDRATGRARGFGFVVFADPNIAERVVLQKHMINGKTVEAKKAVPRDEHTILNKSNSSVQGSPGPANTKKIFVGGLASSVTEADFKKYFAQFGTITDVVVMYDHRTQRPRGFGFITYDSEDAVDKVLQRAFHELNGKMVEVKLAVPKEMSPSPNRNQMNVNNLGSSRISMLLNEYAQGFNPIIGYGVKPEGRYSPAPVNRAGFSPFGHGYGIELNFEANPNQNYAPVSNGGFGRPYNPAYSASIGRYGSPGECAGGNGEVLNPAKRNHIWGLGYGLNGNSGKPLVGSIGENWGTTARSGSRNLEYNSNGYGGNNGVGLETSSSNGVPLGDYSSMVEEGGVSAFELGFGFGFGMGPSGVMRRGQGLASAGAV
ncbi:PREDICTED: heterogeneous nuclear ribonucleoprotein 1 [Tarenaya hassleriana]|uniref:heterogeneous nuclear ribonucleoprotein 1 n=1 Tax=Tarenaya hassleriana TaxID=28532 RepID=UPI00053C4729|nr:PREDICTED: heterogeneous nuclear ribonucleoprotein 1 [Tarenaya hassleriana]XP_010530069.1 PREDICTED: heterogeneous nuclear ribonucleoprotein 1 [Tarenaya hassleriana]